VSVKESSKVLPQTQNFDLGPLQVSGVDNESTTNVVYKQYLQ
jgi:hypothetical protein